MKGYLTAQEVAGKWGITVRQVQILCKEERIVGAERIGKIWIIPENAPKPTRNKAKTAKTFIV
jgi:hypothetical protein